MSVYVITNPELGWDCVIGVVNEKTEELVAYCKKYKWVISEQYYGLQTVSNFIWEMGDGEEDEDEDE